MKKKLALAAALIPNPNCCSSTNRLRAWTRWPLACCGTRSGNASARGDGLSDVARAGDRGELCSDVGIIAKGQMVHQGTMEELRRDGSLEDKFLAVVGDDSQERQKLSWLEA